MKIVAAVFAVLCGYFLFNLWAVWSTGRAEEAKPVDAIVVMGAAQYDGRPSPMLAARLDHVVELWGRGLAPVVVVTGGKLPGDRFTEAQASSRYLQRRGIPAESILEEGEAHTSYGSLRTVAELLRGRGLRRVLLVSDPFHMLRIQLIAEELGLDASVSATRSSPLRGGGAARRMLAEAAGVSLGRIVGFERVTRWFG